MVAAARRMDRLTELVGEIERDGGTAMAVQTDVADRGKVERLRDAAVERFGRIDVWVNNAGLDWWAAWSRRRPRRCGR